jgi:hypothetical protein
MWHLLCPFLIKVDKRRLHDDIIRLTVIMVCRLWRRFARTYCHCMVRFVFLEISMLICWILVILCLNNYFLTRPLLNGAGEFAVSRTNNVSGIAVFTFKRMCQTFKNVLLGWTWIYSVSMSERLWMFLSWIR